jgi:hypothetical protein
MNNDIRRAQMQQLGGAVVQLCNLARSMGFVIRVESAPLPNVPLSMANMEDRVSVSYSNKLYRGLTAAESVDVYTLLGELDRLGSPEGFAAANLVQSMLDAQKS